MRNSYATKEAHEQMMPQQSLEHIFNRDVRLKRKNYFLSRVDVFLFLFLCVFVCFFSDVKMNYSASILKRNEACKLWFLKMHSLTIADGLRSFQSQDINGTQ